jgi:hypothetical protein
MVPGEGFDTPYVTTMASSRVMYLSEAVTIVEIISDNAVAIIDQYAFGASSGDTRTSMTASIRKDDQYHRMFDCHCHYGKISPVRRDWRYSDMRTPGPIVVKGSTGCS